MGAGLIQGQTLDVFLGALFFPLKAGTVLFPLLPDLSLILLREYTEMQR